MLSSLKIDEVYCPFSYLTDFTVQSILKFPSEIWALFFKLVWHMKILDGKLSNWRPVAWIQSLWKLLYLGSRNSTSLSFFVLLLQFVTAHQNRLATSANLLSIVNIMVIYSHVAWLSFSLNNCIYFAMGINFNKELIGSPIIFYTFTRRSAAKNCL